VSEETGVPEGVLKLIQRYEAFRQIYLKGEYNETQLRREFVDPLFRALGWDVDNNQGFSEAYKDVVHEQTIKFRGQDTSTKFIDYAFRLGGVMKFIVETKKAFIKDCRRCTICSPGPPVRLECKTLTQYPHQF